ncbi:MAG: asparagine synthetase B [Spirochaetes bacterium]|nr:asparagine synthetase B [Spirochaetota bacterium]
MSRNTFIINSLFILLVALPLRAQYLFVPMDDAQTDHLKAYGLVYAVLTAGENAEWLLNYRAGSFLFKDNPVFYRKARLMGVTVEKISESQAAAIYKKVDKSNCERIYLEKPPKVAVYSPAWAAPWDDAVTLALTYAEITYEKIWDKEVLSGDLSRYDWLHLHHEDFTGQFNRFVYSYAGAPWYQKQVALFTQLAKDAGYASVREHKGAVSRMIQKYVADGGFLFAMCAATETIDVALSLGGVDFVPPEIDGTPIEAGWEKRIDYSKSFAFTGFTVNAGNGINPFSDIDFNWVNSPAKVLITDFDLFNFSAKIDPVPCMLNQCHASTLKGFYGITSTFRRKRIKDSVTILAETPGSDSVRYLHGNFGKGSFTFYGGHDPEDPNHYIEDMPTELTLHKNSPGYRLILNNVLFPAAKKEKKKT